MDEKKKTYKSLWHTTARNELKQCKGARLRCVWTLSENVQGDSIYALEPAPRYVVIASLFRAFFADNWFY